MVGFCSSPRFAEHLTGPHHPERPDRLRAIFTALRDVGMLHSENPLASEDMHFGISVADPPQLVEIEPYPATAEQLAMVHAPRHVERVRLRCHYGGLLDAGDTVTCPASYEIALLAAGAGLRCVDAVMTGEVRRAFAAVRPPGHHAEPNASMGFCLFNNVALAARHAQRQYGLKRVAIVDFDVHHGNGTQAIFQTDPTVLLASIHEDPNLLFPHTGFDWEIGAGAGRGFTVNAALSPKSDDRRYLKVLHDLAIPKIEAFAPELLLISAGFDAHGDDPMADMMVSEEGFYLMTRALVDLAERCCGGRIVSMLEGGYDLRALARSTVRHLLALSGR